MALLLLIDTAALAYRAHFAFIKRPLTRSDGKVTSALFGYCNTVISVVEKLKPTHVAAGLDLGGPTFRHEMYPAYKAHRPPCPPELSWQLSRLPDLNRALGIEPVGARGFEADDIIGALSQAALSSGMEVRILSGDKDFLQLLRPGLEILRPGREDDYEVVGEDDVPARLGVGARQVVDYLALVGDDSDGVPGAPGVGPVTAAKLLAEHGVLDEVLRKAPEMPKKNLSRSLLDNREQILLSRRLAVIRTDVPGMPELGELAFSGFELPRLLPALEELEFPRIIARVRSALGAAPDADGHAGEASEGLDHRVIRTKQELEEMISAIGQAAERSVCLEWGEANPLEAEPGCLCFSWEEGKAAGLSLDGGSLREFGCADIGGLLAKFKNLFASGVGGHDLKPASLLLGRYGCAPSVLFDTYLEATLIFQGEDNLSLDRLCLEHAGLRGLRPGFLAGDASGKKKWDELGAEERVKRGCLEAELSLRLHGIQMKKIKESGLERLYLDLELPLLPVIAGMERHGVSLDAGKLADFNRDADAELAVLTDRIYGLAGEKFNINSPQQLGQVLFDRMRVQDALGIKKVRTTKTGYATDASVLQAISGHPIGRELLRYRFLSKLRSTYLESLPAAALASTGRVHTHYLQNGTATGRLSSRNPNLQNIPLRSEEGGRIREAFVPSGKGLVMLSADYSQIELRVLAHLSGVEDLVAAFLEGRDIHTITAARVFGSSPELISREQRTIAKAVNFGLIYGMGPKMLAEETGMSMAEAKSFIIQYFESFPGVKDFLKSLVELAREKGFAETLSGRRRPLPDLRSGNGLLKSAAENMALNTPIQGSAADIIKWAMIRLDGRMNAKGLPLSMILQVHDELVFECPESEAEAMSAVVREEMCRVPEIPGGLKVPLVVEVKWGRHWLAAHS